MAKLMPEAELQPRPGDHVLSTSELLKISVFQGVAPANLEKFPGYILLRKYQKGETICRQGDPGWTAFYLLKTADLLALGEARADLLSANEMQELRERQAKLEAAAPFASEIEKTHPQFTPLSPGEKRMRAAEVEPSDSELARKLRQTADAEEIRQQATVSLVASTVQGPHRRSPSLLGNLLGGWFARKGAASISGQQFIPIDGPTDLNRDAPVAALYEGEVFGEMSCLNRYPRSATVRAADTCFALEMLRNVFEVLQKNKPFKEQMDAIYRRRVLRTHLRALPIFSDLNEEVLSEMVQRVELVEKEPGEVLFREGDPSDGIYVIRIGMVKVSRKFPGGERILAYRARGEFVGEIGLLRGEPRMATCTALDHPIGEGAAKRRPGRVELVRIKKEDFEFVLGRVPELRTSVEAVAAERLRPEPSDEPGRVVFSQPFDELGLLQGQKLMLIDLERCTRCDECVRACVSTHLDGRSRLFREGPRFENYLIPATCRQCLDPVCMIGCPVGSIHKGVAGEIIIESWCIGCEICAKQCPYDAINMHELPEKAGSIAEESVEVTQRAVVCDQCQSLSDGVPSCVYACPHDAALRVDAREFFSRRTAVTAVAT